MCTSCGDDSTYDTFETTLIHLLNLYAPMKTKYVRANNGPFMNKILSKATMTKSRLRNKFLKCPSAENEYNYKKHRNYCTKLFKRETKKFYNNIDISLVTDNKKFWQTVRPLFSEKHFSKGKLILVEDDNIVSKDNAVAEIMNTFFSNIVQNLDIKGYRTESFNFDYDQDHIFNIITMYKDHPSITKIKESVNITECFHFTPVNEESISKKVKGLDKKKASTFNGIPPKILAENYDIISSFIAKIYNDSNLKMLFPVALKFADITPTHKKDDTTNKENYRCLKYLRETR